MKPQILLTLLFCALAGISASAQRDILNINNDWHFRFSHEVRTDSGYRVDLPHTWNAADALAGKPDYKRGIGNYTKQIFVPESWRERRIFVRFQGAGNVADVFINGKHLGEHRGGYEAFVFEITDRVNYGKRNSLLVRVNNAEQLDLMPLVGDFNFYGGLYRGVELLITDKTCISPLDYASLGVYLIQRNVSEKSADVDIKIALSNGNASEDEVEISVEAFGGNARAAAGKTVFRVPAKTDAAYASVPLHFENPRLWNGTADPFLYEVVVKILKNGVPADEVRQALGLRYFHVDSEKGFFLNGKHVALRGVCRHQESALVGNALSKRHHDEDFRLMREMGANAVRLSHYPQDPYFIGLLDKAGFVAWSEIPFVGPGGYADKGFVDSERFKANGKRQLTEMIRQLYNHPSICFWGLFNELNESGDNPVAYVRELNDLAHREDPTRLTVAASNQNSGTLNNITDLIAWNRYDGWYGSKPGTLAEFLDRTHAARPKARIGISEYGAGASIYHQQETLKQPAPGGRWHPENWQTYYHIENWRLLSARPFVWGTFIWNMFDFGAAHRTEGDRAGFNDKGLVTFDRKVRKEAFYFYKANWNPEPMVRIAGKRAGTRSKNETTVEVFSNCDEVTLIQDGKIVGSQKPDSLKICRFKIALGNGESTIEAVGRCGNGGETVRDSCRLRAVP